MALDIETKTLYAMIQAIMSKANVKRKDIEDAMDDMGVEEGAKEDIYAMMDSLDIDFKKEK